MIRAFFAQLPSFIDEPTRVKAEHDLARIACQYGPNELQRYAVHYALVLNPDGTFSDKTGPAAAASPSDRRALTG